MRGKRASSLSVSIGFVKHPGAGDEAPDFTLDGVPTPPVGGYHLAGQRGKVVVLVFYPGDFTPVCTRQLQHYEEQRELLLLTGAVMWAVSSDKLEKHERMAKSYAISFPLLADEGGEVAALYGMRSMMGTAKRSLFVLDREGIIRYRREELLSLTYRSVEDILGVLRGTGLVPVDAAQPPALR